MKSGGETIVRDSSFSSFSLSLRLLFPPLPFSPFHLLYISIRPTLSQKFTPCLLVGLLLNSKLVLTPFSFSSLSFPSFLYFIYILFTFYLYFPSSPSSLLLSPFSLAFSFLLIVFGLINGGISLLEIRDRWIIFKSTRNAYQVLFLSFSSPTFFSFSFSFYL